MADHRACVCSALQGDVILLSRVTASSFCSCHFRSCVVSVGWLVGPCSSSEAEDCWVAACILICISLITEV